ncbi:class I adenylate-forming enzyme family protein [Bacillus sp. FJAT-44742]|uniref:class I adenylate-forming enzyme family protein n=1 Tax=Bacillus sp. FJAT-44742 TaxID=2014005 RepID=UPI000C24E7AD|nr:class I adenylate-forming enzyme family protein [Bacillus sp. FJAT-44742]
MVSNFKEENEFGKHNLSHLYDLFLRGVKKKRDGIALIQDERHLTYKEVEYYSIQLANYLRSHYNIKKGDRVAAFMMNSMEYGCLVFACMKIGAVLLPLNIRLQKDEIDFILEDAQPKVCVGDEGFFEEIKRLEYQCPLFLSNEILINNFYKDDKPPLEEETVTKDDPAFLIYTSGTTGRPKGALLHHGGVIHTVLSYQMFFETSSLTKTIIAVPMFHVTGLIGQLLHVAYVGGTSVILKRYQTRPYIDKLLDEKANFLFNVPTIFTMLLSTFDKTNESPFNFVETIAFGGAPMSPSLLKKLEQQFPKASLHNCYGATETCSPTTIMPKNYPSSKQDAVGVPIPQAEVKVIGENGEELPEGEIGELIIKGPMVIKKYWNFDEANKKNFQNGFWFSGDYGTIDIDGYVYIKDRKKDMINRGGENIYSIEIENVLNRHEAVEEAAVVGVPHQLFGEVVKAFVVPLKESLDIDELRDYSSRYLADYKVPEYIEIVKELPKNPGGKILKNLLKNN